MLHHYNYSSTLSHFLNYHQLDEQSTSENEQTSGNSLYEELGTRCKNSSSEVNGKSFTIAAILGLKNNGDSGNAENSAADLSVVNLSVHPANTVSNCSRLQLPVRHGSSGVGVTAHYSVGHGCPGRQTGEHQKWYRLR